MNLVKNAVAALAVFGATTSAQAITVLTFEGIADSTAVGNYYNGGAGGNLGIAFSGNTLALIDQDAGGKGNFANEPSSKTAMFFLTGSSAILNVAAGFDTGFSFFYSSSLAASVSVWSGVNATGTLLGTLNLDSQYTANNCKGDPTGQYCNWSAIGVSFAGLARSIDFAGTANMVAFDDITFGSATAGGGASPVPVPATAALVGAGMFALLRGKK